jgi:hypothetical protein
MFTAQIARGFAAWIAHGIDKGTAGVFHQVPTIRHLDRLR